MYLTLWDKSIIKNGGNRFVRCQSNRQALFERITGFFCNPLATMGQTNAKPPPTCNFEQVQQLQTQITNNALLINVLSHLHQDCLIKGTLAASEEETVINQHLAKGDTHIPIVLYGRNHQDEQAEVKWKQLTSLGFSSVALYRGGMFEWMLLRDVYGNDLFPISGRETDLLRFK